MTSEESKEKVCAYEWKNDRYGIISCVEAFIGATMRTLCIFYSTYLITFNSKQFTLRSTVTILPIFAK